MKLKIFYVISLLLFKTHIYAGSAPKFDDLKERINANIQLVGKTFDEISKNLQSSSLESSRTGLIADIKKKQEKLGISNIHNPIKTDEKLNIIETILHDSLQVLFCSICDINAPNTEGKVDIKNRIEWLKNSLVIFSADISNFNNKLNGLNPALNYHEIKELALDYLRAFSILSLFMRQFIDQAGNNTLCAR